MKKILERINNNSVLILGFGREGNSTYKFIRRHFPSKKLGIADLNPEIANHSVFLDDKQLQFFTGAAYLEAIREYGLILKSPGIPLGKNFSTEIPGKISSQTDLFLASYGAHTIGITGTKGKSTTTSLIYHILKQSGKDVLLAGNIGIPPFDIMQNIHKKTFIVFEMSSHQLEHLHAAPHISVMLNLYPEHLDHYGTFGNYSMAKFNAALKQKSNDYFIYFNDDISIRRLIEMHPFQSHAIPYSLQENISGALIQGRQIILQEGMKKKVICSDYSTRDIKGNHNLLNIMAASVACSLSGISAEKMSESLATFKGLEHRIEFAGEFHGIRFYNDSIATIPEAVIQAIITLKDVDTIILGGYDRGIEYKELARFIAGSEIRNIIVLGAAGARIGDLLAPLIKKDRKIFRPVCFNDIREIIFRETRKGSICLLSPAAASYDEFKSFEERGRRFKELIKDV